MVVQCSSYLCCGSGNYPLCNIPISILYILYFKNIYLLTFFSLILFSRMCTNNTSCRRSSYRRGRVSFEERSSLKDGRNGSNTTRDDYCGLQSASDAIRGSRVDARISSTRYINRSNRQRYRRNDPYAACRRRKGRRRVEIICRMNKGRACASRGGTR